MKLSPVGTLPGPSRRIRVEPLEWPETVPQEIPRENPREEPAPSEPQREPEKEPVPV